MSKATITKTRDDSLKVKARMLTLEAAWQTWMVRKGYPMYQLAQKRRWMTENASEGATWKPVTREYGRWKMDQYQKNKAKSGSRLLVLSGDLSDSVMGRSQKYNRVVFTPKGFSVATTLPYAKYVDEARPFTGFGNSTDEKIKNSLKKFVLAHIKGKTQ
jgi:hypothetical protein